MRTARTKTNSYAAYARVCSDNIMAIIAEIKARHHLTDETLAKRINMNANTFRSRKADPSTFRMFEVWALFQLLNVPDEKRKSVVVKGEES